jgi:peptidyl-prolyl cis-trans isomerase A (cyclophilin A)
MTIVLRSLLIPFLLAAPAALAQQTTTPPPAPAPTQSAPQAPSIPAAPAPPDAPAPQNTAPQISAPLPDAPGASAPPPVLPTGPTAVIDSSMGQMRCKLFSKLAPNTVANFIGLADGTKDWTNPTTHAKEHGVSLYNGTTFHRVIPEFMIQGGDPAGDGTGDPGYFINDEIVPGLIFDVPGRLAMANSGPNTDGSQFFITVAPQPSLEDGYTIFGQCDASSVSVADAIAAVDRDSNDKPLTPVTIDKVLIVPQGQPIPAPPQPAAVPAAPATPTAPQ